MRNIPEPFKTGALTTLARNANAYFTIARRFGNQPERLVSSDTALCIEAPPGSGNSFLVQAFSLANPELKIAHHRHVSAQVVRATALGIPTLAILRDPIDCVLARISTSVELRMIGPNLRMWLAFWTRVGAMLDRVAVVRFEDMVAHPEAAIDLVNRKYSTAFNSSVPESDVVFEVMHEHRRSSATSAETMLPHPNVPDPAKAARKREVRPHALAHRLASPAQHLYKRITTELLEQEPG